MNTSAIVKRIRATNGLSRADLARLADVAPSTVGRIERGAQHPTPLTLQNLLDAAGMAITGKTVVSAGDVSAIASAGAHS